MSLICKPGLICYSWLLYSWPSVQRSYPWPTWYFLLLSLDHFGLVWSCLVWYCLMRSGLSTVNCRDSFEYIGMFWDILTPFKTFWTFCNSLVKLATYVSLDVLRRFVNIMGPFVTVCDILRCFGTFWNILRHFGTCWHVLVIF